MADTLFKQPRELLDFDIIAARSLGDSDTIDNVTAFITGPDDVLTVENISWTDVAAKVWIAGGSDDATYKVTALIYSVGGREIEGEFYLRVKDL
jgi:hypothetical protein